MVEIPKGYKKGWSKKNLMECFLYNISREIHVWKILWQEGEIISCVKDGSMTIEAFINRFLDMLLYIPYIKDGNVKIQQFLGCLPPNFRERIEFDMPKILDTTLQKSRLFYEHGKLRHENINRSRDMYRTFSYNHKPGFNPLPYRK